MHPYLILGIVIGIIDVGIWIYWRKIRKDKAYKLIDEIIKEGNEKL